MYKNSAVQGSTASYKDPNQSRRDSFDLFRDPNNDNFFEHHLYNHDVSEDISLITVGNVDGDLKSFFDGNELDNFIIELGIFDSQLGINKSEDSIIELESFDWLDGNEGDSLFNEERIGSLGKNSLKRVKGKTPSSDEICKKRKR